MIDYNDITAVNEQLGLSQEADNDNRDMVRETHHFLDKRDGQWEPEIIKAMQGRPRYTFDKCNPVVDGIAGEMEGADFGIRVMPAGGSATKDVAKTYDGLLRNVQNISNATHVYNSAGRAMVESGLGGWEVSVDWVDADSFDQDFIIKWVSNFEDRVWFDVGATEQDMSDARHVFVLDSITPDEYKARFPEGSGQSIGTDKKFTAYDDLPEVVTVGRIIYKEEITIELVQMSDGSVYERDDDFDKVLDDLADQGITIERERKKKSYKVMSRLFDAGDFLNKPEDTVFKGLPVIPTFGNFKVREGKVIYRGAIEKLMDAQRTYNYARSREIEDVALSPPAVTWATRKQLSNPADKRAAENMSVSARRVYLYETDPEAPGPPLLSAGPTVSPGVQQAALNSLSDMQTSSARAPLQNGDIEQSLSGVAINALNSRSDTGTIKYFKAQEIAICATAKILMDAIPNLYDSTTQKRILNEDGSYEMIELNQVTIDMATGEPVHLNDLSQGKYDVTCEVGDMFANRQQETVKALNELAQVVPGLGEISADIMLQNISAPGVDQAAERVRQKLISSGVIPDSQLTDEERTALQEAQAAAAQQPPELSPDEKIAEAEVARVQAETADVQNKGMLKQEELRIKEQDILMKAQNSAEKLQMEELGMMMKHQQAQADDQQAMLKAQNEGQMQVFEILQTQAETMKVIREAMGVAQIPTQSGMEAYNNQAEALLDGQQLTDEELDAHLDSMTNEELMEIAKGES